MKWLFLLLLLLFQTNYSYAQNLQDIRLLSKTIIPQIQSLETTESIDLLDRLINFQSKLQTARQRFFLWSISAFLMQKTGSGTITTGIATSITDGDTFSFIPSNLSSNPLKIRLLGIDTPEKREVGNREATDYLTNQILNTTVTIISPHSITTDKYWRTLAYVLNASGTLLNLDLLIHGYARVMTLQSHPLIPLFENTQNAQDYTTLTRRLYCTDFQTCDQARAALDSWATYLDGDSDGVPCETSLCKHLK